MFDVHWALAGTCLNLLFTVIHHGKLLCFPLCSSPSLTRSGVDSLMEFNWLRVVAPTFKTYRTVTLKDAMRSCGLPWAVMTQRDSPWPYGWEDKSHFGPWPSNIIWPPFCFRRNLSSCFVVGKGWGGGEGRGCPLRQKMLYKKTLDGGLPPGAILSILQTLKRLVIFLFSLKSFDF